MTVTLLPGPAQGTLAAIPSKSAAHRLLICAALGDRPVRVVCHQTSQDIEATVRCLNGLGASIRPWDQGYDVTPLDRAQTAGPCDLDCGESGSTLRFLLPVAGALGAQATFHLAGRLAQRPLGPLTEQLEAGGCTVDLRPQENRLTIQGQLQPGDYTLPGDVSSQFISGMLFALPLLEGESTLTVTGPRESVGYVNLTLRALAQFGVVPAPEESGWRMAPQPYHGPNRVQVEGDWSNAAPWLCLGALGGESVTVKGMDPASLQGDKACVELFRQFGLPVSWEGGVLTARNPRAREPFGGLRGITIDAAQIPDMVPALSVCAALSQGETRILNAQRLRLKESDRIAAMEAELRACGGVLESEGGTITVHGCAEHLHAPEGILHGHNDHRVVMSLAVLSAAAGLPLTVDDAEAIQKSWPNFFAAIRPLGVEVEYA